MEVGREGDPVLRRRCLIAPSVTRAVVGADRGRRGHRRARCAPRRRMTRRGPPGGRRTGSRSRCIRCRGDGRRRRSSGRTAPRRSNPWPRSTVAMAPPTAKTRSVAITGTTSQRPRPRSRRRTCMTIQIARMASAGGQTQLSRSMTAGPGWNTIRTSPIEPRNAAGTAIQVCGWALKRVVRSRHEAPAEPEGEQHRPGDQRAPSRPTPGRAAGRRQARRRRRARRAMASDGGACARAGRSEVDAQPSGNARGPIAGAVRSGSAIGRSVMSSLVDRRAAIGSVNASARVSPGP